MRRSISAISAVVVAFAFVAILAALRLWTHLSIFFILGAELAVLFAYRFASAFFPPYSKRWSLRIGRLLLAVLPGTWAAACFLGVYTRNPQVAWAVILFGIIFHFAIVRRYLSRPSQLVGGSKDAM